jgi:hypothetical protein
MLDIRNLKFKTIEFSLNIWVWKSKWKIKWKGEKEKCSNLRLGHFCNLLRPAFPYSALLPHRGPQRTFAVPALWPPPRQWPMGPICQQTTPCAHYPLTLQRRLFSSLHVGPSDLIHLLAPAVAGSWRTSRMHANMAGWSWIPCQLITRPSSWGSHAP